MDDPKDITATQVYKAQIVIRADEARALLARLEAEGEWAGKDSKPVNGGHIHAAAPTRVQNCPVQWNQPWYCLQIDSISPLPPGSPRSLTPR